MKMDEKGDGDSLEDIVAGRTTGYVTTLSTDTASLSDSDPEDHDIPENAEVHTLSRDEEEKLTLLDGVKPHSLPNSKQKSPVQPFHLKGMSSTFSVRSQSIFDALEGPRSRVTTCPDVTPEWNFKRPFPPAALVRSPGPGLTRNNRPTIAVPDYVAHPERWTEYNLEDVAETSNRTNTMVAQEFLEGMRRRKVNENLPVMTDSYTPAFNQDGSSSAAERIVFAKPVKRSVSMEAEDGVKKEARRIASLGLSKIAAKWGEEEEEDEEEDGKEKVQFARSNAEKEKQDEEVLTVPDVASALDKDSSSQLGFHRNKKRIRKNVRTRVDHAEDEDSS